MEKIFGVVILYNPPANTGENIASYLPLVEKLLVIDNSEPASAIELSGAGDKLILLADGENRGIAARLNQAARYAIAENADWLLTMDQDSFFDESHLLSYQNCFQNFEGKNGVAMFGVEFEKESERTNCSVLETDMLITSGSLVNLAVFQKLGGFDENLFIDEVDFEYCLRAKVNGYKTIRLNNIFLHHSLGTNSQHRSLKNFQRTNRSFHSPVRIYYMVRNFLYVWGKYKELSPRSFSYKRTGLLNRMKNNLIYKADRLKTAKYIILGFKHYKKGTMGKLNP